MSLNHIAVIGTALTAVTLTAACAPKNMSEEITNNQTTVGARPDTPFDRALACLGPKLPAGTKVAIGRFEDGTGKFQSSDGGNGYYVSQSSYDQVGVALTKAGIPFINLNDHGWIEPLNLSPEVLAGWANATHMISGSTDRIDFIPGGGIRVEVAGFYGEARRYAINIGKIANLKNLSTGLTVAVEADKSIEAFEAGAGFFGFKGNDYIDSGFGFTKRGATGIADSAVQKWIVYEALSTLAPEEGAKCAQNVRVPVDDKGNTKA